jgi:hypothetical protein
MVKGLRHITKNNLQFFTAMQSYNSQTAELFYYITLYFLAGDCCEQGLADF